MQETLKIVRAFEQETSAHLAYKRYEQDKENLQLAKASLAKAVDRWDYDSIIEDIKNLEFEITHYQKQKEGGALDNVKMQGEQAQHLIATHDKEMTAINKQYTKLNAELDGLIKKFVDAASPVVEEMLNLEKESVSISRANNVLPVFTKLVPGVRRQKGFTGIDEQIHGVRAVEDAVHKLAKNLYEGGEK